MHNNEPRRREMVLLICEKFSNIEMHLCIIDAQAKILICAVRTRQNL